MYNILNRKKTEEKKIKKVQRLAKKVETTLNWLDLEQIVEDAMILKKEKKTIVVKGIKIIPKNILIEDDSKQARMINELRGIFNRLQFKLYHQYVYSKVNIMNHYEHLEQLLEKEENPARKELILDDMEKANAFANAYRELSFYIMLEATTQKELEKNFQDLCMEFERSNLQYEILKKSDYQKLVSYLFENDLIHDYFFATGIFDMLQENNAFQKEVLYDD